MGPHREFRVAVSKNKQTRRLSSRYSSVDIKFLQQVQVQQRKIHNSHTPLYNQQEHIPWRAIANLHVLEEI